jgi:hypothetical protein
LSCTKNRPNAQRGPLPAKPVGTLAMHQNTIDATKSAYQQLPELLPPSSSFPKPSKCQKPLPPMPPSLPPKISSTHCTTRPQQRHLRNWALNKSLRCGNSPTSLTQLSKTQTSTGATNNTSPRVPNKPSLRVAVTPIHCPLHRYPPGLAQQPTLPQTAYHVATVNPTKQKPLCKPSAPAPHTLKHFAKAIVDPTTGKSLEYRHLIKD